MLHRRILRTARAEAHPGGLQRLAGVAPLVGLGEYWAGDVAGNANVVRGAVDAWNAGDMDRLRTFYDPDVVVVRPLPDWSDAPPEVTGGRDELMRAFAQIREPWDATDVLEVLGDLVTTGDRVIARHRWKAEGHGPPLSVELTYVHTVRNARIVEIEIFWDYNEALEAVGLREQAMSQQNVEVVRCSLEAWNESADAFELVDRFYDPDADHYPVRKFPEARPCHGRDEIAQFQADYLSAWDRYEAVINDLIAVGDDRVLAHTTVRGEGRESGVKLDGDLYHCYWLRHQRILRLEDHLTLTGALRALGLSGDSLEAAGLRE